MGRKRAFTDEEALVIYNEMQANKWTLKETSEMNSVKKGLTQATLSNYFKKYKQEKVVVQS